MTTSRLPAMYRPPSRPPKGAWAQHLHEQRRARGLSQMQAFELVYKGLHLSPKSRAVYIGLDMGDRQPTDAEAEYLASVFGWPTTDAAPVEAADPLITALDRQTQAINDLVARLDTFVGPLGELVADLVREKVVATGRHRSGVGAS